MIRRLGYALEAVPVRIGLRLLGLLGPVAASNLAGGVARALGPLLPVSRVANANLRRAMPELEAPARRDIVRGVWENLGRTVGELANLGALRRGPAGPGWDWVGEEHLRVLRAAGKPALLVTGHLANWEVLVPSAVELNLPIAIMYRAAKNPFVDRLVQTLRRRALGVEVPMFAKGAEGARAALAHLKSGGMLGLLVDQKLDDGIAVPFFGEPAMTAPAAASFALHLGCAVLPVHAVRLGAARFRLICEPPLELPASGARRADIAALTARINARLEAWIRADPAAWLWLHRRWSRS
jgi:KDO2-lipid IV(A) lauroyltransferase